MVTNLIIYKAGILSFSDAIESRVYLQLHTSQLFKNSYKYGCILLKIGSYGNAKQCTIVI